MAFVLSPDIASGTLSFQVTLNGSDAVVQVPIGYDGESQRNFSLMVTFSPGAGDGPGEFELAFCIVEFDEVKKKIVREIWDGLTARQITHDPAHMAKIESALLTAVDGLIRNISPRRIHMTTITPHLPDKALRKFNRIATLFRLKGYRSGLCDPYRGKHLWVMERK